VPELEGSSYGQDVLGKGFLGSLQVDQKNSALSDYVRNQWEQHKYQLARGEQSSRANDILACLSLWRPLERQQVFQQSGRESALIVVLCTASLK